MAICHSPIVEWNFQASISNFQKISLIRFTIGQALAAATPLLGDWNKENVLAASLLAQAVGMNEEAIQAGVSAVKNVPGRMEWVTLPLASLTPGVNGETPGVFPAGGAEESPGGDTPEEVTGRLPRVLIDYAVTPGALERLYKYVREETSGRIFAVLGAA
ncbi:MAG: hypothetical protein ACC618_00165, partial [Patescibacteria group bacterium]